jgi:hypothetical protein
MHRLVALVWWPAFLALLRPAECTQAPRLEPGSRIRFDARSLGGRLIGTLVAWESDTLVVKVDGDAEGLHTIVPADSVTRLDVRGERRMTLEGAALGLLGGTLLALVADPSWLDENGDCTTLPCLAYEVSPNLDTRVAVLSVAGTLLGTIIGSETKRATWATVPLQGLRVGPTQDGGLALGVRISF